MSRKHSSHNVRDTSLKTFFEDPERLTMRQIVFNAILKINQEGFPVMKENKDGVLVFDRHIFYPTDKEIAKYLGFSDPNKVRPRRNDLMKHGFIREAEKRKCTIGGKESLTWDAYETLKNEI